MMLVVAFVAGILVEKKFGAKLTEYWKKALAYLAAKFFKA
jgi:hypothetical protein